MRRKIITVICIVFTAVLLAGAAVPWALYTVRKNNAVPPAGYDLPQQHRIVEFGFYPQSAVTDETLLAELNAQPLKWISYGYYSGNVYFGSAEPSDFMRYADAQLNGVRYRAVTASDYRPYCCHLPNEHTQLKTRIQLNHVYWFRWDPIRWIVLNEENGLMMSESVLDCDAFCKIVYVDDPKGTIALGKNILSADYYADPAHTVYACDYAASDARKWQNGTFLETVPVSPKNAVIVAVY